MSDETDLHDKYKTGLLDFPDSWQVSLPHGNYVRLKRDQARALYEGVTELLKCDWNGILECIENKEFSERYKKALALLRKGIGSE